MGPKLVSSALLVAGLAYAAPAPQASASATAGSTVENGPTNTAGPAQYSALSSSFSALMASATATLSPGSLAQASNVPTMSAPPLAPGRDPDVTSHGPYTGTPTTTGAVKNGPAGTVVPMLGPNPTETYYNANGGLTEVEPLPYQPAGGLGTQGYLPRYQVNSDFDFESIALGVYQEWIELDLFHNGLAVFSAEDFTAAGLTAEDRSYIEFMADQEAGHATLLSNMLGEAAPPQCQYDYPYTTVREFVDFCQRLTRWGESGVWGFINHLDSREVAQLLAQSIATEARQQMSFRQMSGLHPMSVWFETGIPQSWAWTYLAPYIASCPANATRLAWQNFPTLHIVNNPNINRISPNETKAYEVSGRRIADPSKSKLSADKSCINSNVTGINCSPAISRNRSEPLSFPGKQVFFEWEAPGQAVGPNNSYVTSSSAGTPRFVAWVNQLNMTYTDLTLTGKYSGYTFQPNTEVYQGDPMVNQTMFVALTDTNMPYTPFNLSFINPHVAALGLYQAG